MKRTIVVPDLQVPYHDEVAVKNVSSFIKAIRPDAVVTLGDEIDLPQISRCPPSKPRRMRPNLPPEASVKAD